MGKMPPQFMKKKPDPKDGTKADALEDAKTAKAGKKPKKKTRLSDLMGG